MKPLLLFGTGAGLPRILHEVRQAGLYEVVGIIDEESPAQANGAQAGAKEIAHYTELAAVPADLRATASAFIVDDQSLLNQQRLARYMAIKRLGLPIIAIASQHASIASGVKLRENVLVDHGVRILPEANIGANTWIMQSSEIGAGAKIGSSCWIGSQCLVSDQAVLGKNCTLAAGVIIGAGVVLPPWTTINQRCTIDKSPETTVFLDPRFRAPVYLFDKPQR